MSLLLNYHNGGEMKETKIVRCSLHDNICHARCENTSIELLSDKNLAVCNDYRTPCVFRKLTKICWYDETEDVTNTNEEDNEQKN